MIHWSCSECGATGWVPVARHVTIVCRCQNVEIVRTSDVWNEPKDWS